MSLNNKAEVHNRSRVELQPKQKYELLFKFQTFREVTHSNKISASTEFIKQRHAKIEISCNNKIDQSIKCNLMPHFAPVDHVFRFYKPQNSYFEVRIPPFLQFGDEDYEAIVSKPNAQATLN